MSLVSPTAVTVTTDATELYTASGGSVTVTVQPDGAALVVGAAGVTTSTGLDVVADAMFTITLEAGEALYGVVASSTATVKVLVQGA